MIRGTKEWAVAEINCCVGCPHGCRYCYARTKALKNGIIDSAVAWLKCRVLKDEVAHEHPLYPGQVMFPAAHDIVPENLDACISVMKGLLAGGNKILVVSKPSPVCIAGICDELYKLKEQILFRFTITTRNQNILTFWEPGAPTYRERKEALQLAFDRGFKTSVSIEPMLEAEDITGLVEELIPFVNHSIWVGKMNKIESRVALESCEVAREVARIKHEQNDDRIRQIFAALRTNHLVRWKESIKTIVGLPPAVKAGRDI